MDSISLICMGLFWVLLVSLLINCIFNEFVHFCLHFQTYWQKNCSYYPFMHFAISVILYSNVLFFIPAIGYLCLFLFALTVIILPGLTNVINHFREWIWTYLIFSFMLHWFLLLCLFSSCFFRFNWCSFYNFLNWGISKFLEA